MPARTGDPEKVTTLPTGCSEPLPLNVAVTPSNRISTNTVAGVTTNYCYDAAGNLIHTVTAPSTCPTSGPYQYTFDAENHLTSTAGVNYTYDGDGKRVQKSNLKLYWYGMSSDPLDETDSAGNTNNPSFFEYVFFNGQRIARRDYQNNVNYYFADHLGTARVVTNSSGALLDDSDFYPFGGERASCEPNGAPGCTLPPGSGNNYKFSSKERDSESGNDYFGARHYSSGIGRWLSPDRLNVTDDRLEIPSSTLNKYVYGANNPFRFVDLDGRDIVALYNPPNGVRPGHFILYANNPKTGESAILSFGPRDTSTAGEVITAVGGFQESTKDYKLPTSADELRQDYAVLSIQTTPEQAQEVIDYIKNLDPSNTQYNLFSRNCTTVCRDALKIIGLVPKQNSNITPAGLWDTLYSRYGRKNLFQQIFAPNVGPRRTGNEYGNPRFGMNTFDFLWLYLKPPRACTTIQGPNGPETHCVD